jgi:Tol biopolymer transport system component
MNIDGTNLTNLTRTKTIESQPVWFPDGSKIFFVSFRNGKNEIYQMNLDGSQQVLFNESIGESGFPAFTPSKVVYQIPENFPSIVPEVSEIKTTIPEINPPVSETSTMAPTQVQLAPVHLGKIAFATEAGGSFEIYSMNTDGTGLTNLTKYKTDDISPDWSPDGTKIAYSSWHDDSFEIYVMNSDGSNPTRLTYSSGRDDSPSWSPDGKKIAFSSTRNGDYEIFVMDSDGQNQMNLSNYPGADDAYPDWSPDGTKIVFASTRSGNSDIYIMNADGSNPINIVNNNAVG